MSHLFVCICQGMHQSRPRKEKKLTGVPNPVAASHPVIAGKLFSTYQLSILTKLEPEDSM